MKMCSAGEVTRKGNKKTVKEKLISVKLASHLSKNKLFIRILNALQKVPEFLPKIKK